MLNRILFGLVIVALTIVAIAVLFGPPLAFVMGMGWPFYMIEWVGGLWVFILGSIVLGILYGSGVLK